MRTLSIAVCLASLCMGVPGWAFHEPGADNCRGCHAIGPRESTQNNQALLLEETASDVCLNCHATDYGAVFSDHPLNPAPEKGGGNFIFLLTDNLNDNTDGGSAEAAIPGDAAGHNLNAPKYGLSPDATLPVSPGGSFASGDLGCTSCHAPHGNGNFRLLHGVGPVQDGLFDFINPAPQADGISLAFGSESASNHTAYRAGMSAWCANCHSDFHTATGGSALRHPSGVPMGHAVAAAYSAYNGTEDPFGGAPATAYLAEVPFEENDSRHRISSTTGPSANATVMCLSCHRAHASSAPDAGRWDFNVTRLDDDGRASGSYATANPFGKTQRSLCNKCHVKDAPKVVAEFRD